MKSKLQNKKTTMETLAKEVGVSLSSISRAFSGTPGVSEVLRKKIITKAKSVGYVPSASARRVTGLNKQEKILGILFPKGTPGLNPIAIRKMEMLLTEGQARGYRVISQFMLSNPEKEIQELLSERPDCCIVWSPEAEWIDPVMSWLIRNVPTLIFEHEPTIKNTREISDIEADRKAGTYQAMKLLHLTGVKTVLTVGDMGYGSSSRMAGCELAREQLGLEFTNAALSPAASDFCEGGYWAVRKALERSHPHAILGVNDFVALGAIRAVNEHGLKVPEQIKIIGFDNSMIAPFTTPPLTTIEQSVKTIVNLLFDQLEDKILNKDNPDYKQKKIKVPTHLIIRQTAPVTDDIRKKIFKVNLES